jgi:hypothetical protein
MSDKALYTWVGGLSLTFLWFGLWGGIVQPVVTDSEFDVLAGVKLLCGLVALGIAIIIDQLECVKDLLRDRSAA